MSKERDPRRVRRVPANENSDHMAPNEAQSGRNTSQEGMPYTQNFQQRPQEVPDDPTETAGETKASGNEQGSRQELESTPRVRRGTSRAQYAEDEYTRESRRAREHGHKRPWSTAKKTVVILSCLVLCLLAALLIKFMVDVTNPAGLFDQSAPTPEPTVSASPNQQNPQVTASPTPDPAQALLSQADLEFMKNRVNVLVLGIDESTERENWGSFRTDTMILVTINFETNDVDMISVPRDSYVKLYSGSGSLVTDSLGEAEMAKINSAFSKGGGSKKNGYAYSMQTVSKLLGGIPINYYVGFNMNVVKAVVDAMGGVDYDVDINVTMNGRTLSPGLQHLDGQQVLDYCRQRKGSSDIARVERQQKMIKAIFQQLKSTGQIANIPSIYQAVETNIETNLSFTQICSLALMALDMDLDQLNSHTVEGGFLNISNVSYWGVSADKLERMVKEVFGVSVSVDPDVDLNNIEAAIEANRAAIATELALASATLQDAQDLLARYGAVMDAGTKSQLSTAMENVEHAIEEESKVLLDSATAALGQLVNAQKAIFEPGGGLIISPTPNGSGTDAGGNGSGSIGVGGGGIGVGG